MQKLTFQATVVQYKQAMRKLFVILDMNIEPSVLGKIFNLNQDFQTITNQPDRMLQQDIVDDSKNGEAHVHENLVIIRDALLILFTNLHIYALCAHYQSARLQSDKQLLIDTIAALVTSVDITNEWQLAQAVENVKKTQDISAVKKISYTIFAKALDGIQHLASENETLVSNYAQKPQVDDVIDFLQELLTFLQKNDSSLTSYDLFEKRWHTLTQNLNPKTNSEIAPVIVHVSDSEPMQNTMSPLAVPSTAVANPPPPQPPPPPPPPSIVVAPLPPTNTVVPLAPPPPSLQLSDTTTSTLPQNNENSALLREIQSLRMDVSPYCAKNFTSSHYQKMCESLACSSDPDSEACEALREEHKKYANFDCTPYDQKACETRRCTSLETCDHQLDKHRKPAYLAFNPVPMQTMQDRSAQLIPWIDEEVGQGMPQSLANQLKQDLALPLPTKLGDVGSYVNQLAASLNALRNFKNTLLDQQQRQVVLATIADVWAIAIHDSIDQIKNMCDTTCFAQLQKSCNGECAHLYKKEQSTQSLLDLGIRHIRSQVADEEEEEEE